MARSISAETIRSEKRSRSTASISMQVTAVLMDLPSNTHLETRIFASGRAAYSRLAVLDAMPGAAIHNLGMH